MDRSSTSTLIGKLRALGLLVSTPNPADHRSMTVGLSDLGRQLVTATLDAHGSEFSRHTDGWTGDELAALLSLLDKPLDASR